MSKKIKHKIYGLIISIITILLIAGVSCSLPGNTSVSKSESITDDNVTELYRATTSDRPTVKVNQFRLSWLNVKHDWVSISPKDFGSYLFADSQTYNGSDPIVPRFSSDYSTAKIKLQEEISKDDEINHVNEETGIIQVIPDKYGFLRDADNKIFGEIRSVNINQSSKDQVHTLYFQRYNMTHGDYIDPIVVGSVTTYNGSDPVFVRINSVEKRKAYYSLSEFAYDDGGHLEEKLHFIIIEKGCHVVGTVDGVYYVLEAGKETINAGTPTRSAYGTRINLLTNFDKQPYVLGALQTNDVSKNPAIVRVNNVSNYDYFYARLQLEEKLLDNSTYHPLEKYGYIAIGSVGTLTVHKSDVVANNGKLQVKNNQLCNAAGNPVQLKGMSSFWMNWDEGAKFTNEAVIDWLVRDWKIDVYRIAIGVNPYDGREVIIETDAYGSLIKVDNPNCGLPCEDQGDCYVKNPSAVRAKVEELVDACVERGIYVILDWHVHDALMDKYSAKFFFQLMALKYINTPNVIFEIWNEPSMENNDIGAANDSGDYDGYIYNWDDDIKPYCEEMITAIRGFSDNIIICPTENFDQRVFKIVQDDSYIKDSLSSNILYSVHFYAGTTEFWSNFVTGADWTYLIHHPFDNGSLYQYIDISSDYLPIFVSEWGTSNFDGGQDPARYVGITESEKYLDLLEEKKISWCNWSVTDKPEAASILKPGACKMGFWSYNALSTSGKYVRSKIRE